MAIDAASPRMKSDIETIVGEFRQFLEAAGDRAWKTRSIILEIK